jgi:flavin-dependent dehydrogenase
MESGLRTASPERTDILICGAGLAGLTLALQLRREVPDATVTVIERQARPLPEACFKVGESTVEIAIDYFERHVGLKENLHSRQLPKLGLRYFLGGGGTPFEQRPEVGVHAFPPLLTHQLDRGRFENDLRDLADEAGVHLVEGARVLDVEIDGDGGDHCVQISDNADGSVRSIHCRWVVDATGRRRLLQKKLKLAVDDNGHHANAGWFRIKGALSVNEFVPAKESRWHGRVFEDRWYSTNHLLGRGYWVWLIPLSSGYTSLGVVVDADIHPDCEIQSFERLRPWLERHEPRFLAALEGREISDYLALRNYSYGSRAVFSRDRWSCVGIAGVFLDPFYSPGSDYIGFGNTITTEMIRRDLAGTLTDDLVEAYNKFFLEGIYRVGLPIYRGTYEVFGAPRHLFLAKSLWDSGVYWGITCQIFLNDVISQPEILPAVTALLDRVATLQNRVQGLLIEWARRAKPRPSSGFFNTASVPFTQFLTLDLGVKMKTASELVETLRLNLDRLEEAAQFLFFTALAELLPDRVDQFPGRWVNAWAIGLDPAAWERDGLFQPATPRRDIEPIGQALYGGVLTPLGLGNRLRRKTMRAFMTAFRGKLYYAAQPVVLSALSEGRLRLRRSWFIKDQPPLPTPRPDMAETSAAMMSSTK